MPEGQVLGPGAGKVIPLPGATIVFKALSGRAAGDYTLRVHSRGGFRRPAAASASHARGAVLRARRRVRLLSG